MRLAYLLSTFGLLALGCDEEPGWDGPTPPPVDDDEREERGADARVTPPLDAAQPARPDASAPVLDAPIEVDAGVDAEIADASMPSPGANGVHTEGTTCLGSTDTLLLCPPQQCVPERIRLVDDGTASHEVECLSRCDRTWPAAMSSDDPFDFAIYIFRSQDFPELDLQVQFDRKFAGATTTEQARAALWNNNFHYRFARGVPLDGDPTSTQAEVYGMFEIVSFDGRRIHIRGTSELANAMGPTLYNPRLCGPSGDSPFSAPSICEYSTCAYASESLNGSGASATLALDLSFDLH